MGEQRSRPGQYWDMREARWVPSPVVEPVVPAQATPVERSAELLENDVRSG